MNCLLHLVAIVGNKSHHCRCQRSLLFAQNERTKMKCIKQNSDTYKNVYVLECSDVSLYAKRLVGKIGRTERTAKRWKLNGRMAIITAEDGNKTKDTFHNKRDFRPTTIALQSLCQIVLFVLLENVRGYVPTLT